MTVKPWDFPIRRVKMKTIEEGETAGIEIPEKQAIVRNDTNQVLGVVSSRYGIKHHVDAVDAAMSAIEQLGEMRVNKEITSHDGGRMFMDVDFPDTAMEIASGDRVSMRLILANSYDLSLRFGFMLGAYRWVCTNGMKTGKDIMYIRRKHYRGLEGTDLEQEVQASLRHYNDVLIPSYRRMAGETFKIEDIKNRLVQDLKFPERVMSEILRGSMPEEQNGWELYNKFTEYLTHKYEGSFQRNLELGQIVSKAFAV